MPSLTAISRVGWVAFWVNVNVVLAKGAPAYSFILIVVEEVISIT